MPQSTTRYVLLTLIIMIHSVLGTINYAIYTDENYPGKCVINTENDQKIIGEGEIIPHPKRCGRIECGREGWAVVHTCHEGNDVPDGCEYDRSRYFDLSYPACCRSPVICNEI
ncbi:uncharacterized protein Dana_GF26687 [Drosophila ananassae]|uniref:Single domain-containing protein n=1 Tax=Drosophila ananassae TaxID=7217 RepID=A0A0N8NZI6_DROAN|nr:uncharacterized protein LOC26515194 isoform X1 [Drosophila ananassae]KPU74428.1 uncharacterized protein Dana_GF26687 [Drosophila ananassae]